MTTTSIAFMCVGFMITWGGLALAIYNQLKCQKAESEVSSN